MRIIVFFLLVTAFSNFSIAQNSDLGYGIDPAHRVIQNNKLKEVRVISDIDPRFEASWVKEYISVNLSVDCNQETLNASGTTFAFNDEQLRIIKMGQPGKDISVVVSYFPDNMLPKEIKEMNFTYSVGPDKNAEFQGGENEMKKYLKANSIDQLVNDFDQEVHQARVGFTVNSVGKVVNVNMLERSRYKEVDALLIETIQNMPPWTPAENVDGTMVPQDFEYIITRDRCVYNYLHDN